MSKESMRHKEPDRFQMWVLIDPVFGHPDWHNEGMFDSESSLAEKIKNIMEEFHDSSRELNKYVMIDAFHAEQPLKMKIIPSEVLKRHFPGFVETFDSCMKTCDNCLFKIEMEYIGEKHRDYICRKGKSWFGIPGCPYFENLDDYIWKPGASESAIKAFRELVEAKEREEKEEWTLR